MNREEIKRLAQICVENDLIVCSDEMHADIVYEEKAYSIGFVRRAYKPKNNYFYVAIKKSRNEWLGSFCSDPQR